LDTSQAVALREVLWNGDASTQQDALAHRGVAWSAPPSQLAEGTHPLNPPDHLLVFESERRGQDWLVVVTFGELLYRVPLSLDWHGMPPQSWWFDPMQKKVRQLPAVIQMLVLDGSLTSE
jgi:hypothetical protein